MSAEEKIQINYLFNWAGKIGLGVLAWLAFTAVSDIKDSIKAQAVEHKQFSKDMVEEVRSVNDRLIRVEDKMNYLETKKPSR